MSRNIFTEFKKIIIDIWKKKKYNLDKITRGSNMELDVEKIRAILKQIDRNLSWVARQIGTDRSNVAYWIKSKTIITFFR